MRLNRFTLITLWSIAPGLFTNLTTYADLIQ